MLEKLRRIVTGKDPEGKSFVVIDGPPGAVVGVENAGLATMWSEPGGPIYPSGTEDNADGPVNLYPPKGGHHLAMFGLAPDQPGITAEEIAANAKAGFAAVNAADCQPDTTRHPGMHETPTIDYIILIKGQVRLILEKDEVDLRPGDVVVQRATNHAWVNTGAEPALLACILIDAEVA